MLIVIKDDVEMEGNSLHSIGLLLERNTTLKKLHLHGKGVDLIHALLPQNEHLTSLNLGMSSIM